MSTYQLEVEHVGSKTDLDTPTWPRFFVNLRVRSIERVGSPTVTLVVPTIKTPLKIVLFFPKKQFDMCL